MTYLMVATTAAVYAILTTDSDKEVGREEKGRRKEGCKTKERGERRKDE